jgi:DnaJ-class molecular chaperone
MDHIDLSKLGSQSAGGLPLALVQPSYYEVLNVDAKATRLMIREAYLRMKHVLSNSGDGLYGVAGGADISRQMDELEEAFGVLNDETKRAEYDRKLSGATKDAGTTLIWDSEPSAQQADHAAANDVIQTSRSTLKVTRTQATGSHNKDLQERMIAAMEDGDVGDGSILVRLREIVGVSQQEVQERTKISLEYIRGMENNRFDRLPQVVYVKGFMRSYLRYLNVPELEKIVTAYAARLEAWQAGQK